MLENLQPLKDRRARCKVADTIAGLDPEDAVLLKAYMADTERWSANGLSNALASRGIRMAVTTIIRHRNGQCAC